MATAYSRPHPVLDEKSMEEARTASTCEPEAECPSVSSVSAQSFQHVIIFALLCSIIFSAALAFFFYSNAQCPVVPQHLDSSLPVSSRESRAHIRYEQRTFTGALKYNVTTDQLYRSIHIDSADPHYAGDPRTTPGLDRAWKSLLSGSKFPLSNGEATSFIQTPPTGRKSSIADAAYGELSVFRSLECLNSIRLALDHDFYSGHGPQDGLGWQMATRVDRTPLDYCIDYLRQELQCSADLTIVPVVTRTATTTTELVAAQPRTCRRWDDVRTWLDRRHERLRFSAQLLGEHPPTGA